LASEKSYDVYLWIQKNRNSIIPFLDSWTKSIDTQTAKSIINEIKKMGETGMVSPFLSTLFVYAMKLERCGLSFEESIHNAFELVSARNMITTLR
jgi:hypothetical protein